MIQLVLWDLAHSPEVNIFISWFHFPPIIPQEDPKPHGEVGWLIVREGHITHREARALCRRDKRARNCCTRATGINELHSRQTPPTWVPSTALPSSLAPGTQRWCLCPHSVARSDSSTAQSPYLENLLLWLLWAPWAPGVWLWPHYVPCQEAHPVAQSYMTVLTRSLARPSTAI